MAQEADRLRQDLAAATGALEEKRGRFEALATELAEAKAAAESAGAELASARSARTEHEEDSRHASEKIASLEATIDAKVERIKELRASLSNALKQQAKAEKVPVAVEVAVAPEGGESRPAAGVHQRTAACIESSTQTEATEAPRERAPVAESGTQTVEIPSEKDGVIASLRAEKERLIEQVQAQSEAFGAEFDQAAQITEFATQVNEANSALQVAEAVQGELQQQLNTVEKKRKEEGKALEQEVSGTRERLEISESMLEAAESTIQELEHEALALKSRCSALEMELEDRKQSDAAREAEPAQAEPAQAEPEAASHGSEEEERKAPTTVTVVQTEARAVAAAASQTDESGDGRVAELQGALSQAQEDLKRAHTERDSLMAQVERQSVLLEQSTPSGDRQSALLQQQLLAAERTVSEYFAESTSLRRQLTESKIGAGELENQVEHLNRQVGELAEESEKKGAALKDTLTKLESAAAAAAESARMAQEGAEGNRQATSQAAQAAVVSEAKLQEFEKIVETWREACHKKDKEIHRLNRALDAAADKLQSVSAQSQDFAELQGLKRLAEERAGAVAEDLQAARKELAEVRRELADHQKDFTRQIAALQGEIRAKAQEVAQGQLKVASLEATVKAKDAEILKLDSKVEDSVSQLQSNSKRLSSVQTYREDAMKWKTEAKILKQKLEHKAKEVKELNHMLKAWDEMRQGKDHQISGLLEKCKKYEDDAKEKARSLDNLRRKLTSLSTPKSSRRSPAASSYVSQPTPPSARLADTATPEKKVPVQPIAPPNFAALDKENAAGKSKKRPGDDRPQRPLDQRTQGLSYR